MVSKKIRYSFEKINRDLKIPRFSITGTGSAILNSLHDDVNQDLPVKATRFPGVAIGLPVRFYR